MLRKMLCLTILVLLTIPVLAEESAGVPVDKSVGYTLLDSLGQTFYEMAVSGSGGPERLMSAIKKLMGDARRAKDQKQIDGVFFARYNRILAIIKLAISPDPDGILLPIISPELDHFVMDILAEPRKSSGPEAINQVANAIADEIINLHLYLDNIETKEKLRKAWEEKFAGAMPKKDGEEPVLR